MDLDRTKIWDFIDRFGKLTSGTALLGVLAVADRSGLLTELGDSDWHTVGEVAKGRFSERYVEEILSALAAGGIIEHADGRFRLPPENAACLIDSDSPYLMAGWLDFLPAAFRTIDAVAAVTVSGGGVPTSTFDDRVVAGIDRTNGPAMKVLLTRKWIPAMPEVVERLEAGAQVADIGCGSGAATLAMARAYPSSTFVGYDIDSRAIERSRLAAQASGLGNVSFEQLPAEQIPDGFDLVTAFDVIHDLPDPLAVMTRVREALGEGGSFLMMEPKAGPTIDDNQSDYSILLYGISVLYCLPQSMTGKGPGLGAAWGPVRAEALSRQAGFSSFLRLPIENQFSAFYQLRP